MQSTNVKPDQVTFTSVLRACASLEALEYGKQVHTHIIKTEFELNVFAGSALIDMYAKCRSLEDAHLVFDRMPDQNVVSWTTLIAGYAQQQRGLEALQLFGQLQKTNVAPDHLTFASVLNACADVPTREQGKQLHAHIVRKGFKSNVVIGNALVDMYAKCGDVERARQVFNEMAERDGVSWNAMIAGYSHNGHFNEALALFHQMQWVGIVPDVSTIVSVLSACAALSALQDGKDIHDYVNKSEFGCDAFVQTALIDMYAKCGNVDVARHLFDKMSKRYVASWNAMIAGYTQNGCATEALTLFHQMQLGNITPDRATIVTILPACANSAVLQYGKEIHGYIIKNKVESDVYVGNSLIAMYAKCSSREMARQVFDKMPGKNVVSWNALIAGYAQNGDASESLTLFHQMQQAGMMPDHVTVASVLRACATLSALQEGSSTSKLANRKLGLYTPLLVPS